MPKIDLTTAKRLTIEIDGEIFGRIKAMAAFKNISLRKMTTRWLCDRLKKEEDYLKPQVKR